MYYYWLFYPYWCPDFYPLIPSNPQRPPTPRPPTPPGLPYYDSPTRRRRTRSYP
jgi:hypothetical protein